MLRNVTQVLILRRIIWNDLSNGKSIMRFGTGRHRWQDDIKTDVKEMGREDVDLFRLARDTDQWQALLNTVMNLQVP